MKRIYQWIFLLFACENLLAQNNIVQYEYWLNNDYASKVQTNISPVQTFNWQTTIPCQNLDVGLQVLNVRFKDSKGQWSPTISSYFQKLQDLSQNKLVAYEYWVNDLYAERQTGNINNLQSFVIFDSLDIRKATKATNYIHYRFKDALGLWSSTLSQDFYRPVEPAFTSIAGLSDVTFTNTTKYADTYQWDFGDNTAVSTQVNPVHTYAEPGAYEVKLIAKNKMFTDSVKRYVEVEGIRAINSNKGGNGGLVSINIYGGGLSDVSKVTLQKNGVDIVVSDTVYLIEPGNLCVRFNLAGQQAGIYDVKIYSSHTNYFVPSGFEIINSNPIDNNNLRNYLDFQIIGNDILLVDRWQTVTFVVKNKAANDMYAIPLNIEIKANGNPEVLLPADIEADALKDSLDLYVKTIENGERTLLYPLFIPLLNANGSINVQFKIKNSQNIGIKAYLGNIPYMNFNNEVFFRSSSQINLSTKWTCLEQAFFLALGEAITETVDDYLKYINDKENQDDFMSLWVEIYRTVKENDNAAAVPKQQWENLSVALLRNWYLLKKGVTIEVEVIPKLMEYFFTGIRNPDNNKRITEGVGPCIADLSYDLFSHPEEHSMRTAQSFDPNELLGVSGFGEKNYITKRNTLNYTLYFENDPEFATAPVQEIFLTDTLDLTKFNPEQFSFGTFTFRDITVEAIPGVTEFSKDVDMRPKGENSIVRISAVFDKVKGIINWHLIALDPETMDLTENPYLGILYPNTAPPIGEGNVTYSIGLRSDISDGAVIENQGHITFDLNEPIATNVYVNTIDMSAPVSRMSSTYQIENDSIIDVSWSGTDAGSGIANYTVYVSENDGDYYPCLLQTGETSGKFEGKQENTYKFYAVATDNVGNIESKSEVAELTVVLKKTVIEQPKQENQDLIIVPNPAKHKVTFTMNVQQPSNVKLVLYNTLGQLVLQAYNQYTAPETKDITVDISRLISGIYIVEMQTDYGKFVKRLIIK